MKILVTGGAGFIGSALIRFLVTHTEDCVINVDKLTYAGNLESLESVSQSSRYKFEPVDICDADAVKRVFSRHKPDCVIHLAAESHVDRSIDGPDEFVRTNVFGTFVLLRLATEYFESLDDSARPGFKFHHVSTDEVYGDLGEDGGFFTEDSAYAPSSPYSATKASSDHLVRSWHRTYKLPTLITNCSNNYGPFQFPEKLIPLVILNAIAGKKLPVYGKGQQVRDWLHVEDHVRGLYAALRSDYVGETFNIGGDSPVRNIDIVGSICRILDELRPRPDETVKSYSDLIEFVQDRPGHDQRYAIDASKISSSLNWSPRFTLESGLRATVLWYLDNEEWCRRVLDGSYALERLGRPSRMSS